MSNAHFPLDSSRSARPSGPSTATKLLAILLLLVAGALVYVVVQQRFGGGNHAHRDVIDRADGTAQMPTEATNSAGDSASTPRTVDARGDLASDEKATIELFKAVNPAVVHVTSINVRTSQLLMRSTEIPRGTGSGFLWDEDGHIVTNNHVIAGAQAARVMLSDNSVYDAELIGSASDKDLAVLKIKAPAAKLKAIAVGKSGDLQVGQKVFAIGNPFGLDHTLTTGVISGLGREIVQKNKRPISDVIQTDAAINPGNSGGPLLDSAGRLIGVNTAIYSTSGAYAGIGFAVPVDTVNEIVPQLIAHGKVVSPGLGVTVLADATARGNGIEGVVLKNVPAQSAAGKAGLIGVRSDQFGRWVIGDVIVAIDDNPVKNQTDLFRGFLDKAVGDRVTLKVKRDGSVRSVPVALQALSRK